MSYCRFVGPEGKRRLEALWDKVMPETAPHTVALSDVYVFESVGNVLECCGCLIADGGSFRTRSRRAMLDHLAAHVTNGHHVPPAATDALGEELEESGDELAGPCAGCGGSGRRVRPPGTGGVGLSFERCGPCAGTGNADGGPR